VRRDTWVPPYSRTFCRAGPACPAVSAGKESSSHGFAVPAPFRQGGQKDGARIVTTGVRPRNDTLYECGTSPGGRPQGSPLRRSFIQKMRRKGGGMTKKKEILLGSLAVFALALIYVLYRFNYLPHPKYANEKFGIETYSSQVDRDGDGVDDQTDILQSVRAYLATRPKYKSKYYATGYPDDGYGVCTDVVAFGLLGAGYDLMELVHEDVLAHGDRYDTLTRWTRTSTFGGCGISRCFFNTTPRRLPRTFTTSASGRAGTL